MVTFKEIVLGALLHDIGKVIQRAGDNRFKSSQEHVLCRYHQKTNSYSHYHVLYTDGFLQEYKDIFPDEINADDVVNLAAKHHNPVNTLDIIIQKADRYSSGADRTQKESEETNQKYYEQPLLSILSKVQLPQKDKPDAVYYSQLGLLTADKILQYSKESLSREKYQKVVDELAENFDKLKNNNYSVQDFIMVLDNILKHYWWNIPSTTIDEPDINLYDHSRTTAAIAAALFHYHEAHNSLDGRQAIEDDSSKKFLLVAGDVSGIQSYIFDLPNTKYNAKILRARSFEIQAFSIAVSNSILQALDLPIFNKLTDAGGRFLLLLPNTDQARKLLDEKRKEIDEWCIKRYNGELSLQLAREVEIAGKDFDVSRMQHTFFRITNEVNLSKQKKLQTYLLSKDPILHENYDLIESNQEVCLVCKKRPFRNGNSDRICETCYQLIQFGGRIPKSNFIAFNKSDKNGITTFSDTNIQSYEQITDVKSGLPIAINYFEPLFPSQYLPYHVPKDEHNNVMEFHELALQGEGATYLAMFKADVDNLGAIFSLGLGKNVSISRYATLSRTLDFFFSGYMNHLLKNDFPLIYTVFSGGDDVCLIGPWEEIIRFAEIFHNKFNQFVNNNPSITISAAIALAGSKLPVKHMAEVAEDLLEHHSKTEEKNKITIFGTTMSWDAFKKGCRVAEELDQMIKNKKISKSSIYRLLEYGDQHQRLQRGELKTSNALWRSHLAYDTTRNIEDSKIRDRFMMLVEENIDYIRFIAMVALYKNRTK
ncbi:MAG: type III-A CRISPR-associated protein Cas10/Csm1 [Calditrichia bacterium]